MRTIGIGCAILAAILFFAERGETHKPITSKYTYTEDVFPIFSERCGGCHVPGGVAPMSLVTYKESMPWAEAIRGELLAANMPPWYAEPAFAEFKQSHYLSPRELDILMTWVTGGAPQGPARPLPPVELKKEWKIGKPDLSFTMPADFTLAADRMEDTQEFVLDAGTSKDRWIRAVDLQPGTPAIVRDAVIFTKKMGGREANVLGLWLPGEDPVPLASGLAFRWAAGAELVVRIHYRKTWKYEGEALTDRSSVGVYLSDTAAPREVRTLVIKDAFVVERNQQALAARAEKAVHAEAVRPDGTRVPVISVNPRPGWNRRYWFAQPISLPRGTRIESGTNESLWLDVVSQE